MGWYFESMRTWEEIDAKWFGQVPVSVLADERLSALDVKIYAIVSLRTVNSRRQRMTETELATLARVHRVTAGNSLRHLRACGHLETDGQVGETLSLGVTNSSVTKRNSHSPQTMGDTAQGLQGDSPQAVGGTAHRLGGNRVLNKEARGEKEREERENKRESYASLSVGSHFEGSAPDQGSTLDPSTLRGNPLFVSAETLNQHLEVIPDALFNEPTFNAAFERWQRMGNWKAGLFRNSEGTWYVEDDHQAHKWPPAPHQMRNRL